MSEKYYFTQRGLEQAGIKILPFSEENLTGEQILIAGNAFKPENNVEIAYADVQGYTYQRYHDFLGEFMRDFVSMGVAGAHGKTSTTGILSHVLSNITDTSYLIGDGTGRVPKELSILSLNLMSMSVTSCPTIQSIPSLPTLTLTIQTTLLV